VVYALHESPDASPLLVALAAFFASQAGTAATLSTRQATKIGARCWSDVRTLSDDGMEGRRAGTPGHRPRRGVRRHAVQAGETRSG
jgi:hypothetical protein